MGATKFRIGIIHILEAMIPLLKYLGVGLRDADGEMRNISAMVSLLPVYGLFRS